MKSIEEFFKNNKIKIIKLNHCMKLSGTTQYDGFMQLDSDGDYMRLTNKLPLLNNLILTSDDHWVNNEMTRLK